MKKIFLKPVIAVFFSAIVLVLLSSFSRPAGGECFEIYLDGKMIVQRCGKAMDEVQTISLPAGITTGALIVKYSHCGQTGKSRVLTLKSSEGKVVKEWKYANEKGYAAPMKCGVKEIMSVKINGSNSLKLYYTSAELPEGKLLAIIRSANQSKTSNP
jgi:hypothetical protein